MAERRPPARRPPSESRPDTDPVPDAHLATTTDQAALGPRTSPERAGAPSKPERHGALGFLRELPGLILIAFVLALLIKTFLIQAFFIPSESMLPTLQVGDRVIVNKFVYNFREPRRGEIIVFENPNLQEPNRNPIWAVWHWLIEGLGFASDPNKDFIKRVVGEPGDTVEVRRGKVFVDGEQLREPYARLDRDDYGPRTVPQDSVFVMGDNRANSQDSRVIGFIPLDNVVGEAFVIIWKPSRVQWLSGD